eukprot:gnl/MRDRNA2_/MRDRNA2_130797_c0_seq1.p1 gnl/MRDRNA2_/MRDRNA2_130797_c0~~gnl/MRDRNA2_/MRDRNA2_130797_c0_seq1.p1  ORF type:complete len:476 (+),score=57.24 gnl/MRDRNA2_/MRDRNA2_130797_c0_seq1:105-1430(+)
MSPPVEHAEDLRPCLGIPSGLLCQIQCESGFHFIGTLMCSDGDWWGDGECLPLSCTGPPQVPHQGPMHRCAGMASGGDCPLHCEQGYVPKHALSETMGGLQSMYEKQSDKNVPTVYCDRGRWTGAVCAPSPCMSAPVSRRPELTVGLDKCAGTLTGGTCEFACIEGYQPVSYPTCHHGHWLGGSVQCEEQGCVFAPSIANAERVAHCADTPSQSSCELVCTPGFRKSSDLRCIRGQWLPASCDRYCGPVPAAISNAIPLHQCLHVQATKSCPLVCRSRGFQKSGDILCDGAARWKVTSFCDTIGAEQASRILGSVEFQVQKPVEYTKLSRFAQESRMRLAEQAGLPNAGALGIIAADASFVAVEEAVIAPGQTMLLRYSLQCHPERCNEDRDKIAGGIHDPVHLGKVINGALCEADSELCNAQVRVARISFPRVQVNHEST